MKQTAQHLAPIIVALVLVAFGVIGLLAMHSPRDRNREITVVLKSTNPEMEFWQIVRAGIDTAAREYNVSPSIVGPWLERDIEDQIRIFEEVIEERPDGVVLAASDYEALSPLADRARDAGIRIVTIDSGLRTDAASSFIATDNVLAGRKAGERIARLVGPTGTIALISHIREVATAIDRERGVREAFAQAAAEGEVLGTWFTDNVVERAYEHAMRLMEEEESIDGIVAMNELTTIGAARAIRDAGMAGRIRFVGFDHSSEEIALLEEGVIDALVVQKPFNMGYLGVTTLLDVLAGKRVEPEIDTGAVLVDRENLFTPENQRLLFPFADNR